MEWLKEFLGDELYAQVSEKLQGNDKVKLANLASGEYVAKQKYTDKESEVATLNTELTALKDAAKKFEGIDVDALNQKIKDLETNSAKEIEKVKRESVAKELLSGYKFTSKLAQESALNKLLSKDLKLDGDKLLGADDFMKSLQTECPEAFVTAEGGTKPPVVVNTGGSHEGGQPAQTPSLESAISDFYK